MGSTDIPRAVIGLVDLPERQRQDVFEWASSQGNGNLLITGTGRSGKSTAAGALLASLALRHSPEDLHILCVDFGGDRLLPFAELPHVSAMASRSDPELTRRIFSGLTEMLAERESLFRRLQLPSVAALRAARAAGAIDRAAPSDVIVIIDGWAGVLDAEPTADHLLDEILGRGPGLGIHTILTVGAPHHLRTRLAAGFGGRIELRLSDSFDSVIDRQMAKAIPVDAPGRALVAGRHFAQLALPVLSAVGQSTQSADTVGSRRGVAAANDVGTGLTEDPDRDAVDDAGEIVAAVRARWPGRAAPRLRTLPTLVGLSEISDSATGLSHERSSDGASSDSSDHPSSPACDGPGSVRRATGLVLGLAEGDLGPVLLDMLGGEPHLLIYGDSGTGKTTMLRSMLEQLCRNPASSEITNTATGNGSDAPVIEIVIVDYRRGIRVRRPTTGQTWVAGSTQQVAAACTAIVTELSRRQAESATRPAAGSLLDPPGGAAGTTGHTEGPIPRSEIFVLVDDYDLVCSAMGNPLSPLIPFLPYGRDIGFHLLLARRTGGAARAQYESLLQTMGDLGTPVILFSGSPAEGRLAHGMVPKPLTTGRAQYARRTVATQLIQTAWVPAS